MAPVGSHPFDCRHKLQLHIPRHTGQIHLGSVFTSITFSPYLYKNRSCIQLTVQTNCRKGKYNMIAAYKFISSRSIKWACNPIQYLAQTISGVIKLYLSSLIIKIDLSWLKKIASGKEIEIFKLSSKEQQVISIYRTYKQSPHNCPWPELHLLQCVW